MPASSIAQILLRLFALNWFLTGVTRLLGLFSMPSGLFDVELLITPLGYCSAGMVVWTVAPRFSRLLAAGHDGQFNLAGVTERQFYTAAFLVVGLFFTLDSFARVFNWVHLFLVSKAPDPMLYQDEQPSYYHLTEDLMTFIAGVVVMLTSRLWAAKLTPSRQSEQG